MNPIHKYRVFSLNYLFLVIIVFNIEGCFTDPVTRAVNQIDRGISAIKEESSDWQRIVLETLDDLPKEVSSTITEDVNFLLTNTVAVTGIELKCNADFLASRAITSLIVLQAKILNKKMNYPGPAFCLVNPSIIDLNSDQEKWDKIIVSGYDFNRKDINGNYIQVILEDKEGKSFFLPEERIGRTTHYQLSLALAGMASEIYDNRVVKIKFQWAGSNEGAPEIVINPWTSKQELVRSLEIGSMDFTPPIQCCGDGDFDTGDSDPTDTRLESQIEVSPTLIRGRVSMWAREVSEDHTFVNGWSDWRILYEAPKGFVIISVSPNSASTYKTNITQKGEIPFRLPAGESIDRYLVRLDRKGDEAGSYTSVTAIWNKINVIITQQKPTFSAKDNN